MRHLQTGLAATEQRRSGAGRIPLARDDCSTQRIHELLWRSDRTEIRRYVVPLRSRVMIQCFDRPDKVLIRLIGHELAECFNKILRRMSMTR